MNVTLEVCVESLRSALAAEEGGAHRIELCAAMRSGGITPSHGLVGEVCSRLRIPVHVLVRPRPGDFLYTPGELRIMERDIRAVKELGAEGVVVGVLSPGRSIDVRAMRALIRAARPMSVTFHRAFDEVPSPGKALGLLAKLGVDRVLTAGGMGTAFAGRTKVRRLAGLARGRISVMAGGGVGIRTAKRILRETGVREIHVGSAVTAFRASGNGVFRAATRDVDAGRVRTLLGVIGGSR